VGTDEGKVDEQRSVAFEWVVQPQGKIDFIRSDSVSMQVTELCGDERVEPVLVQAC